MAGWWATLFVRPVFIFYATKISFASRNAQCMRGLGMQCSDRHPHSVGIGGSAVRARSVEEVTFVGIGGGAVGARSAEDAAFVSTCGDAVGARIAEEAEYAITGGSSDSVRSVIGRASGNSIAWTHRTLPATPTSGRGPAKGCMK